MKIGLIVEGLNEEDNAEKFKTDLSETFNADVRVNIAMGTVVIMADNDIDKEKLLMVATSCDCKIVNLMYM